MLQRRGRKVDDERVKHRERTAVKTRSFVTEAASSGFHQKTLNTSNYLNQKGIYYNLLGIWGITTKITSAYVFAEGFKNVPTDLEKN